MNAPLSLPEAREKALALLQEIVRRMGFEATVQAREQGEDEVLLQVSSPDASRLIGREAQMLNALQYIVNRIMRAQYDSDVHCVVDVELYRERRKDRLLKDAFDAAEQVRRAGRPYTFAPLGSADRRTIHQAFRDDADLETVSGSEDEDGRKRVTLRLRAPPSSATPPPAVAAEAPSVGPEEAASPAAAEESPPAT